MDAECQDRIKVCLHIFFFVNRYCAKSCGKCSLGQMVDEDTLCVDKNETCAFWASKGECKSNDFR